jgi:hypothetical protein
VPRRHGEHKGKAAQGVELIAAPGGNATGAKPGKLEFELVTKERTYFLW